MTSRRRKGLTLVELVVAIAISIILLTVTLRGVASFFSMKSAQTQEMLLQQNFRFAIDTFTEDARKARDIISPTNPTAGNIYLDESIRLDVPGVGLVTYSTQREPDGAAYFLARAVGAGGTPRPVTEEVPQFMKAYFLKSGHKVLIILVGRMTYFGRTREVSLTSLVYARNLGD
jgi:type II secretory pathway pseudopilin PulG